MACSSHESTGDGFGLPARKGNVGGDPIGGADLGGANDPGTGIALEKQHVVCNSDAECEEGLCTGDSTRDGVCLRVCAAPPDFARPGISVMRCRADEECVTTAVASLSVSDLGVCVRRCKADVDCPVLGSPTLRDKCASSQPGAPSFCVVEQLGGTD